MVKEQGTCGYIKLSLKQGLMWYVTNQFKVFLNFQMIRWTDTHKGKINPHVLFTLI